MNFSKSIVVLLALLGSAFVFPVLDVVPVSPAHASGYTPEAGATFNDPESSDIEVKTAVFRKMLRTIEAVPCGRGQIKATTYIYDSPSVSTALIEKHKCGVDVTISADHQVNSPAWQRLKTVLNGPRQRGWGHSRIINCRGACRGSGWTNHSKYYLFSESGSAKYVVMLSSQNMNAGASYNGWQDMMTFTGCADLYAAASQLHSEMMADRPVAPPYRVWKACGFSLRAFPMNSTSATDDPMMRDLNRVRCLGATGGTGYNGRTSIRLNTFGIGGINGERIANKLVSLGRAKCDVRIVVGAPSNNVNRIFGKAARSRYIRYFDSRQEPYINDKGRTAYALRTHQKNYVISGRLGTDTSSELVVMGSWNFAPNTRSDDVQVAIVNNAGITDSYLRNFGLVAGYSRRVGVS